MTYDETLSIMSVLKAAYPNFYKDMKRSEADGVVDLWTTMFADDPVEVVAIAVKAHIANDVKGFPPHIGAIRNAIVKIQKPKEMTEIEAWNIVRRAVNGASMSPSSIKYRNGETDGLTGAERNFRELPEILQRLVGSPSQLAEWAVMDEEVLGSVVASNFQRSYKVRAAKEREFLALPSAVQQTMAQIAAGMKMPELPASPTDQERNDMMRRLAELPAMREV